MKLITDRTQEDVLLGTEKGRYSYKDLNRVEEAVRELNLLARPLDVPVLSTKTDWGLPGDFSGDNWPVESQMLRYLGNVHRLCGSVMLAQDLPASMQHLDIDGANNIERALEQAYRRMVGVLDTFKYSGELFAGEE